MPPVTWLLEATDIASASIAVAAALRHELIHLRRRMTVTETLNENGFPFWCGRLGTAEVLLVQTGIGRAKAAQAARVTLERFAPSVLVSTGFAGGVHPSLAAGDLVIADRVWTCAGDQLAELAETTMSFACAAKLVALARECAEKAGTRHQVGGILTVDQVAADAASKHRVGQKFGVLAVEMESAAVAEVAAEAGTPSLCVRSISDAVDQDLHLESFRLATPDGRLRPLSAALYLAAPPTRIADALRMRRQVGLAARSFAAFFEVFAGELSARGASSI